MAEQTQNFNLTKDAGTDYYNIDTANANLDKIDKALGNTAKFEKAGGTGTAITFTGIELADGSSKTFIVSTANNGGAATTINGKPLYKPGTTTAPKLIVGKAVTVWYDATGGCFFIKASAEGTASVGDVLAGKTFSNDDDTGIAGTMPNRGAKTFTPTDATQTGDAGYYSGITVNPRPVLSGDVAESGVLTGKTFYNSNYTKRTGTMPNRGAVSQSLPINGSYIIPVGYHNGSGKVTQSIPVKGAATITPGTSNQVINAGQYLSGAQTILGDADLIPANILSGKKIFGVAGSVVAMHYASGTTAVGALIKVEYQTATSSTMFKGLIVGGLTFRPKAIVAHGIQSNGYHSYEKTVYVYFPGTGLDHHIFAIATNSGTGMGQVCRIAYDVYINSTGFCIPVGRDSPDFEWHAWG